jgi:myo-inositol 2-dehydrogenase / D-chiro-inositol 1-dehydrogenase
MDDCRVLLVGLGDIGLGAHLAALVAEPRVSLVGLVDPRPDRRQAARERLGATAPPAFADLDVALTQTRAQAVVLATPPWITTSLAEQCLSAGLFVLAEKPIAVSTAAAQPLSSLPARLRARLQVGMTYRHDPALERLRDWLASGRLGSPPWLIRAHVYDEVRRPDDSEHLNRIMATLEHGSPVLHEGSHVFDWLNFLLPVAGEVRDAWAVRTRPDLPAPNLVGGRIAYPDGSIGLVEFGWLTDGLPRCELSVVGDSGLATLDGQTFRLELRSAHEPVVVEFEGERTARSFARQLERFVTGIAKPDTALEPSLDDALAALRCAETIEQLAQVSAGEEWRARTSVG